jgi:hypothetical protein
MTSTVETLTAPVRRRRKYARYGPHRARAAFRRWRRSRPFWAGLLVLLGGAIITWGPASAYKVILTAGDVVWEGILVGALIVIFGFFLWFQPSMRHFFGVLIVVLSLVSFITSDVGGFFIGMMLAMTGGAMGFAWVPVEPASIKPHLWQRQQRHAWKQRRRIERVARRARIEAEEEEFALPEVAVAGVPVEEPVAVPERELPSRPAEPLEAPTAEQPPVRPGVIETTGTEVQRPRRHLPFGNRRR